MFKQTYFASKEVTVTKLAVVSLGIIDAIWCLNKSFAGLTASLVGRKVIAVGNVLIIICCSLMYYGQKKSVWKSRVIMACIKLFWPLYRGWTKTRTTLSFGISFSLVLVIELAECM